MHVRIIWPNYLRLGRYKSGIRAFILQPLTYRAYVSSSLTVCLVMCTYVIMWIMCVLGWPLLWFCLAWKLIEILCMISFEDETSFREEGCNTLKFHLLILIYVPHVWCVCLFLCVLLQTFVAFKLVLLCWWIIRLQKKNQKKNILGEIRMVIIWFDLMVYPLTFYLT